MQPEIAYINKLLRMRKGMGTASKMDRSKECKFLRDHISYNGYNTPAAAKGFFRKHSIIIHSLIGRKGGKLEREFNGFIEGVKQC